MTCTPSSINDWKSERRGIFRVVFAETPCQKWQGMQFIKSLPKNTLLLFKKIPSGLFFHTRNCLFPIDIIALNELGLVLKVWTVNPEASLVGPMPTGTFYVLEANAGWAKTNNIGMGHNLVSLI